MRCGSSRFVLELEALEQVAGSHPLSLSEKREYPNYVRPQIAFLKAEPRAARLGVILTLDTLPEPARVSVTAITFWSFWPTSPVPIKWKSSNGVTGRSYRGGPFHINSKAWEG
jgi:hypothetical protein